jgi:hypothetical protein
VFVCLFFNQISYFCCPNSKYEFRFPEVPGLKGAVAQLVEQRTENPCVAGSIPAHTTKSIICEGDFINNFLEKERAYSSAG